MVKNVFVTSQKPYWFMSGNKIIVCLFMPMNWGGGGVEKIFFKFWRSKLASCLDSCCVGVVFRLWKNLLVGLNFTLLEVSSSLNVFCWKVVHGYLHDSVKVFL